MRHPPSTPSVGIPALVALAGLAVAVRVVSWSATVVMMNDGPDFLWQAERILAGDVGAALAHPYHPLYGAVVAAFVHVIGAPLAATAVGVSILGGVTTVLAATCATARLLGLRGAALAAGLVAALHPRAVNYSAEVSSDGLFLGLVALSLATFLASIDASSRGSRARAFATGLLAGLAYLARPEGLFVGAAVALWMTIVVVRERAVGRALSHGALVAAGTLVGVAPYVVAIHEVSGEWALSMKPSVATVGLTDVTGDTDDVPDASPHGWPEVVPAARDTTGDGDAPRTRALVLSPSKQRRPVATTLDVLGGTLRPEGVLLLLAGVVTLARRRETRGPGAALLALLVAWCALMIVHVAARGYLSNRHMMIGWALCTPAMGAGLASLWGTSARGRVARAFAALVVLSLAHYATAPRRDDEAYLAAAARHASTLAAPDAAVAVPRRRWGHLTGRRGLVVRFPVHEDDMLKKLRREGVSHLIAVREDVDPAWIAPDRFELVAVFGPDASDPAHLPTPRPWWWRWGLGGPDEEDAAVVLRWRGDD